MSFRACRCCDVATWQGRGLVRRSDLALTFEGRRWTATRYGTTDKNGSRTLAGRRRGQAWLAHRQSDDGIVVRETQRHRSATRSRRRGARSNSWSAAPSNERQALCLLPPKCGGLDRTMLPWPDVPRDRLAQLPCTRPAVARLAGCSNLSSAFGRPFRLSGGPSALGVKPLRSPTEPIQPCRTRARDRWWPPSWR